MTRCITVFEDSFAPNFYPLTYTRPVFDLLCGISTLKEKIERNFTGEKFYYHSREYLLPLIEYELPGKSYRNIKEDSCLFVNGRVIWNEKLNFLLNPEPDAVYKSKNQIVAFQFSGKSLSDFMSINCDIDNGFLDKLPSVEIEAELAEYPWNLIQYNGQEIISDFNFLMKSKSRPRVNYCLKKGAYLIDEHAIIIGDGSVINPGVVLDASDGPILIGKETTIMPGSVILGPAFIGDNSTLKIHSKIYHNTSIGKFCKVGGEVEESIIHSYSNKQHDGFLGHSYLGSWVNLGAGTNNSDLKNNYSSVKINLNGRIINSGMQLLGVIIGDHSKTSIGTQFNTGSVVGAFCNIFGNEFPSKYIPSFAWGGGDKFEEYDFLKAINVASIVMARRNIKLSKEENDIYKYIFNSTKPERTL